MTTSSVASVLNMDCIEIRDAYRKGKLLGWTGLSWEVADSVKVGSSICQFDFGDKNIKIRDHFEDRRCAIVAQIQSFKQPSIKSFIGVISGDNFNLSVINKFGGIKLLFEVEGRGKNSVDIGLIASVKFEHMLDVEFHYVEDMVTVKVVPEFEKLGIIVGAILLKYAVNYIHVRGGN